jgi:hypothetical protein
MNTRLLRFEKAFPEIPPVLPFSKGGELLREAMGDSTFPPLEKGSCEEIPLVLSYVIPAKAGIQYFHCLTNCLDPGFRRGDDLNSIFSQLQGDEGGFCGPSKC